MPVRAPTPCWPRLAVRVGAALVLLSPLGCRERAPERSADRAPACRTIADDAMAGRPLSAEPGAPPDVRRMLRHIYECQALATDSETWCDRVEHKVRMNCLARHHFFHGGRKAPPGFAWAPVMGQGVRLDCLSDDQDPRPAPAVCDALAAAISEQDPKKCAPGLPTTGWCQALSSSDPALCPDKDCTQLAIRLRLLKEGGLELVAREGIGQDRISAAAALGRPEACEPEVETFLEECRR